MLKNYIKMAWRSLKKNGLTTWINIGGLVLGLGGSLFIGLFVLDELAYDQHHRDRDRIYRLTSTYEKQGTLYQSALTTGRVASDVAREFPEVLYATRLMREDEAFLFSKEIAYKEKIIYTDSFFLKVFDIDLLIGNKNKCLGDLSSVLISKTMALKLFGDSWSQQDLLGQTLSVDGRIPLTITGVFDDFPEHSHFRSNLFATVPTGHKEWMDDTSEVYTYVLLGENTKADDLDKKIKSQSVRFNPDEVDEKRQLSLQPITKIHLYSIYDDENAEVGSIKSIYALLLVALFLIGVTVSNFANLYTASSLNRLKEVGIRKAIGALGNQLRQQFLLETILITSIALSIAILAVIALLPVFNEFTGKRLSPVNLLDSNVVFFTSVITLAISLGAGLYPSIYLSRFKVIEALKGVNTRPASFMGWRKGLVAIQFSVSAVMIMLSIVALKQVDLIYKKPVGFDKENIITLANPYMLGSTDKIISLKSQLLAVPGVEHVSITGYTPSQSRWGNLIVTFPGRNENSNYTQPATWLTVDEGFIKTMGLTLVTGRNFLENHKQDQESIIINETAASQFDLNTNGKNPIGMELSVKNEGETVYRHYTVVGVVADFNFGSLYQTIKPVIIKVGYHRFEMALRLTSEYSQQRLLSDIEHIWKKNLPAIPFEYSFIKDRFDRLHQSDIVSSKIFTSFCLVTVIISAFGLFSIVTYSITNRTKEIGIRKVLGASESSIALLLCAEYVKVLLISYLLTLPLAWLITDLWIEDFAYKAEVSWWIYAATAIILTLMTVATLGYQSINAALNNPIKQLRSE